MTLPPTARHEYSMKGLLAPPRDGARAEALAAILYLSENCGGETAVVGDDHAEHAVDYTMGTVLLMSLATLHRGTPVPEAAKSRGRRLSQHIVLRSSEAEWVQDQGGCFHMCTHEPLVAGLTSPGR